MEALAERYMTEAEYGMLEEQSSIKHEYYDGRIYAMSGGGGSNTHAILCLNAGATLRAGLRGKPCRAVGSEQRVKIEATGLQTYPDVSVYCPPTRFEGRNNEVLLNPQIIIEVLSPSKERYDRTTKFEHYGHLDSLTDYILITQDRVLVEHYRRHDSGGWLLRMYNGREQNVEFPDLEVTLPLAELYDGVDVPAGLLPLHESDADVG